MGVPADITIYHAVPTRSCRVLWLLEELGVPYNTVAVDFFHRADHATVPSTEPHENVRAPPVVIMK
jgi:hypothetical protein